MAGAELGPETKHDERNMMTTKIDAITPVMTPYLIFSFLPDLEYSEWPILAEYNVIHFTSNIKLLVLT